MLDCGSHELLFLLLDLQNQGDGEEFPLFPLQLPIHDIDRRIPTFAVATLTPLYICITSALIISPLYFFANSIDSFVLPTPRNEICKTGLTSSSNNENRFILLHAIRYCGELTRESR